MSDSDIDYGLIEELYKSGASKQKILDLLNLSDQTYNDLLESDPLFYIACSYANKSDKEQVELSLLRLAKGFWIEKLSDESGTNNLGTVVKKKVEKIYIKPDISAIKFYLSNKFPDEWNEEKAEVKVTDEKIVISYKKQD